MLCAFSIINCQSWPATNFLVAVAVFFFFFLKISKPIWTDTKSYTNFSPNPLIIVQNLWLCACCHCSAIIENDSSKFTTRRQFTDRADTLPLTAFSLDEKKERYVLSVTMCSIEWEIRVFFCSRPNRQHAIRFARPIFYLWPIPYIFVLATWFDGIDGRTDGTMVGVAAHATAIWLYAVHSSVPEKSHRRKLYHSAADCVSINLSLVKCTQWVQANTHTQAKRERV